MTFDELIESITKAIREGFNASIDDITNTSILKQLTDAVSAGDFELFWRLLAITPGSFRPFTRALERSFEDGAAWIGSSYPKILNTPDGKGVFRFNVLNPRAQQWLREQSSRLVTDITDDTRSAVRSALDDSMLRGVNPRTTALDIVGRYNSVTGRREGGVIGLTSHQQYWVTSTRRQLETLDPLYLTKELRDRRFDGIVERAIEQRRPLTREQIDQLTTRYSDRTLKYRGDMIARTESLHSLSAADYESTKQIVEMGAAREKDVTREWDSAGDSKVRTSHKVMDGQRVGINEAFTAPSGAKLMYPRDGSLGAGADEVVACRCRVKTVIDWIGAAVDD